MEYIKSILEIIIGGVTNVTFLTFSSIIISGAFGGLLSALHLNDGRLIPPEKIKIEGSEKSQIFLGYWADVILGIGAGVIATLPLDLTMTKCIYVAVLAGFGGGNFIAKKAKELENSKNNVTSSLPDIPATTSTQTKDGMVEIEVDTES